MESLYRRPHKRGSVSSFFYGKTHDYVPVFTIDRPIKIINKGNSERMRKLKIKLNDNLLSSVITERFYDGNVDPSTYPRFLKQIQKSLREYVYKEDLNFNIPQMSYPINSSYLELFDHINYSNSWDNKKLRSGNFISNFWYLGIENGGPSYYSDLDERGITTLCCLMAKREMIPYLRMCSLLGEDPHPDALEFWVRDDLDVAKGTYKNLRPHYRKRMKKEVVDSGVKIVELPSLDNLLFHSLKQPKFSRISDSKNWKRERGDEFLQHFKTEKKCFDLDLDLVV